MLDYTKLCWENGRKRGQAIEVQRRVGDLWTIHVFGPDDDIGLTSLGVSLPVATLYRGTTIPVMQNG